MGGETLEKTLGIGVKKNNKGKGCEMDTLHWQVAVGKEREQ